MIFFTALGMVFFLVFLSMMVWGVFSSFKNNTNYMEYDCAENCSERTCYNQCPELVNFDIVPHQYLKTSTAYKKNNVWNVKLINGDWMEVSPEDFNKLYVIVKETETVNE